MTDKKINLKKQLFPKENKNNVIETQKNIKGSKKIQVRISIENFDWLESEAHRTGSNLSAVAGLLLADGILEKKIRLKKLMEEIETTEYYREALQEK